MRRSREDTAETRRRIAAAASELFRARGIEATSVADIMGKAGLTVGGFYRHFDSKEALGAEAIESASRETTARALPLEDYLSDAHRRHPGRGCPVAALCSEIAHEGRSTKRAFTVALERLLATVKAVVGRGSGGEREDVLFAASAVVGALVLSRATEDDALARDLLAATRNRLRDGL
jgi:TetR/AcrR family transcriptional repressor of nem operon